MCVHHRYQMRNLGVTPSTVHDLQAAAAAYPASSPYTPIMPMASLDGVEQQQGQASAGAAASSTGMRQHQPGHTPFYTPQTAVRYLPGSSMMSPSSAAMPSPAASTVFDNQLFAPGPESSDV
jgi:hypothetical protein